MSTKAKILDIAMNLNRIGNWAADNFESKHGRIHLFLNQTTQYIKNINTSEFTPNFNKTFRKFFKEYLKLEVEAKDGPEDSLFWAEQMMTWGNILTHRSKLLD